MQSCGHGWYNINTNQPGKQMRTPKTYTLIIGSMDNFEKIEDLMDYVEQLWDRSRGHLDYAVHEFEAPAECDLSTVQLIGYGIAFENDWSKAGTLSFFIEGKLVNLQELPERMAQ